MTKTDYDKALQSAWNEYVGFTPNGLFPEPIPDARFEDGFLAGYEFGKEANSLNEVNFAKSDHERNLVALGDEYMTARENALVDGFRKYFSEECSSAYIDAYRQGWNDGDVFDGEWINHHPKDLLDRILDEYPDMIENEAKARMKDIENENRNISQNIANCDIDHFRDYTKMLRAEIAKDIYVGCLVLSSNDSLRMQSWQNLRQNAKECIEAADALLAELENKQQ